MNINEVHWNFSDNGTKEPAKSRFWNFYNFWTAWKFLMRFSLLCSGEWTLSFYICVFIYIGVSLIFGLVLTQWKLVRIAVDRIHTSCVTQNDLFWRFIWWSLYYIGHVLSQARYEASLTSSEQLAKVNTLYFARQNLQNHMSLHGSFRSAWTFIQTDHLKTPDRLLVNFA